ncbi:hypothetical protein EDB87DRAFT_1590989 [Lactarius vividus]|nr:hypothetical protein EDB87DRAFT_1590989 [Lactarius vividus]
MPVDFPRISGFLTLYVVRLALLRCAIPPPPAVQKLVRWLERLQTGLWPCKCLSKVSVHLPYVIRVCSNVSNVSTRSA